MTIQMKEQRPLYGIGTVARLAGIKPDTLRVWERRYGVGASHKSDSGRRMYTQTDLEHLQILSRLISRGFRIGEIAALERKTLAAMLEQGGGLSELPAPRPKVLFVGGAMCEWLDRHPGCLSGLDSVLLRGGLQQLGDEQIPDLGDPQLLVVESPALGAAQVEQVCSLHAGLKVAHSMVFYEFASERNLARLADSGILSSQLPLNTAMFASSLKRLVSSLDVEDGASDVGDLATPKPHLFRPQELQKIGQMPALTGCGCTHHLSGLIESLVNFEEFSSQCSVENWQDAATHACVYAYANQARWLMEKALRAVMESHEQEPRG